MIIHDVEQGTDEWHQLRKKRLTASRASAIGANGKGLITYVMELMQDFYSSAEKDNFTGKDMDRGNELEDSAGFIYSATTGNETRKIGFVEHSEFVGCSPDLYCQKRGLVEIKCPADKGFFNLLINPVEKEIKSEYIWQMQMQMLICDKDWCDFVAYNPNFNTELIIIRIEKDQKKFDKLRLGFEEGVRLMKEIEDKYVEFTQAE